jgi:hypothetical protein
VLEGEVMGQRTLIVDVDMNHGVIVHQPGRFPEFARLGPWFTLGQSFQQIARSFECPVIVKVKFKKRPQHG